MLFRNILYVNRSEIVGDNIQAITFQKEIKNKPDLMHLAPRLNPNGISSRSKMFKGNRQCIDIFDSNGDKSNIQRHGRDFLKEISLIGQFDSKCIIAKRELHECDEIWIFDQHACAERINLEALLRESKGMSLDEMKMKACKTAIKFGQSLTFSEQETIIKELGKCAEPFHCAHGRPTCWLLSVLKNPKCMG